MQVQWPVISENNENKGTDRRMEAIAFTSLAKAVGKHTIHYMYLAQNAYRPTLHCQRNEKRVKKTAGIPL